MHSWLASVLRAEVSEPEREPQRRTSVLLFPSLGAMGTIESLGFAKTLGCVFSSNLPEERIVLARRLLAALALGIGIVGIAYAQDVTLKWEFKKDQLFYQTMDTETKQTM